MSHKFEKNNVIFDSDSDEESDSKSYETAEQKSSSSVSSPSNSEKSILIDSNSSVSSPESAKSGFANSISQSVKKDLQCNEKQVLRDHNSNRFSKSAEGKFERDSKGDSDLICDCSASVNESESIISNSVDESFDWSKKTFHNNTDAVKSRIINESSDGESSVVSIDSVTTTKAHVSCNISPIVSPKENSASNSSGEIEVIEDLSVENSSKIFTNSSINSDASKSSLLSGSQSSIHSNSSYNERRSLERQLADKRTAYQNILKAVKTCDPKKLKDGGKLLQEKLVKCKEEVEELKKKIDSLGDSSHDVSNDKYAVKPNALFSTSDQVTANLGKKGLETHRVQAALTVDALVTLHGSLQTCPAEDALEVDPKGLRSELMPHQRYALAWLLWREKQSPAGGILADDMGLGKTLTMIALVLRAEEYKRKNNVADEENSVVENGVRMYPGKTLVICPSSLLGQWQGQIKQHCKPHLLNTLIYYEKRREFERARKLAEFDVVITSYRIVFEENKIVKADKKGPLFRVKWERVIIDEGHVIRNHETKTAQAVCELEAKYRWCLTGTPVQNKELDIYSLLKFLRCSPFDSLPVWKRWVDNKSANGIQRLNTVVKSILLRRTKEELQNSGELEKLPDRTSVPVYINLDEEEEKVYHTLLRFSKNLLSEFLYQEQKKHGFVSDKLRSGHHELIRSANEIKTTEIFVLLLRLRQICCLPGLIHSMLEKGCAEDGIDPADDPIIESLTAQMKRLSTGAPAAAKDFEKEQKVLVDSNPVFEISRPSKKIRTVLGIIKEAVESNDKIVIVSQWAGLLQKLKTHIVPLDIGVVTVDGSVPVKLRPAIIEEFNAKDNNIKVMLLSLTAGGVGLNLTGANRLIIFEPHWNPQLESQACDRIYRLGQEKQVQIYKIICKGTIEEKIEALQKKKLEIASTVLRGELRANMSKLTLADLKILFEVH